MQAGGICLYDNHEPRAVRQLPLDWHIAQPRRHTHATPRLLAILVLLAAVAWIVIALPFPR